MSIRKKQCDAKAASGPGRAYELVGHKYFVSTPMCDAFLVLARIALHAFLSLLIWSNFS